MLILLYFKIQQDLTYSFIRISMTESRKKENEPFSFTPIIPMVRTPIVPIIPIVRTPCQITDRMQKGAFPQDSPKWLFGQNNFQKFSNSIDKKPIAMIIQGECSKQKQTAVSEQIEPMFESKGLTPAEQNSQIKLKNIYSQYLKLFEENNSIEKAIKKVMLERNTLLNNIYQTKKQIKNKGQHSFENKSKRVRRSADQISREHQCPDVSCGKSYGSENSLMQHLRLKHQALHKEIQIKPKREKNQKSANSYQISEIGQSQNSSEASSKQVHCNQKGLFVLKELNILRQPVITLTEPRNIIQTVNKIKVINQPLGGEEIQVGQPNQNHEP